MSINTDAYLSFGVAYPMEYEFPWAKERYEQDLEEWYYAEVDPDPTPGSASPSGSHIDAYYKRKRAWKKVHPMPVRAVDYCSASQPGFILAVPSTEIWAYRGYPSPVERLPEPTPEEVERLLAFLQRWCPLADEDVGYDAWLPDTGAEAMVPRWWLSSSTDY